MQVEISSKQKKLSRRIREIVGRQFRFAFDRVEDRIRRISIVLSDINGPKGGLDKLCRVNIGMNDGQSVQVESLAASWEAASAATSDRAIHAISRWIERQHRRIYKPKFIQGEHPCNA